MCFGRNTKRIKEIQKELKELKKLVETNELERLRRRHDELITQNKLLEYIKINVAKARVVETEEGDKSVVVKFSMPDIVLKFDEDGNVIKNNTFYAINYLNLLSIEDTLKLNEILRRGKDV
jgi:uncharacterized protein YuzE